MYLFCHDPTRIRYAVLGCGLLDVLHTMLLPGFLLFSSCYNYNPILFLKLQLFIIKVQGGEFRIGNFLIGGNNTGLAMYPFWRNVAKRLKIYVNIENFSRTNPLRLRSMWTKVSTELTTYM